MAKKASKPVDKPREVSNPADFEELICISMTYNEALVAKSICDRAATVRRRELELGEGLIAHTTSMSPDQTRWEAELLEKFVVDLDAALEGHFLEDRHAD